MISPDQTSRSQTKSSETDGIACRNNLDGLHDFVAEYPTLGLEQSAWPRDPREGEADQICNAGAERLVSRARVQHGQPNDFLPPDLRRIARMRSLSVQHGNAAETSHYV